MNNNETINVSVEVPVSDIVDSVSLREMLDMYGADDTAEILKEVDIVDILEYVAEHRIMSHAGCDEFLETIVDLPYVAQHLEALQRLQRRAERPYIINRIAHSDQVDIVLESGRQVGTIAQRHDTDARVVFLYDSLYEFPSHDDALLFVDAKVRATVEGRKKEKGDE